jgi:hypothetical protein
MMEASAPVHDSQVRNATSEDHAIRDEAEVTKHANDVAAAWADEEGLRVQPEPPLALKSLTPPVGGRVMEGAGAAMRTLSDLPSRAPPALRRLLVPGRCKLIPGSLPSVY